MNKYPSLIPLIPFLKTIILLLIFLDCVSLPVEDELIINHENNDRKTTNINYGFDKYGLFYISEEIINEVNGSNPKLMVKIDSYIKHSMELHEGYFYCTIETNSRLLTDKMEYCFDIGGNEFIPHAIINKIPELLYNSEDIISNGIGGYNFYTWPVNSLPFAIR